jgi:hypothetical protein
VFARALESETFARLDEIRIETATEADDRREGRFFGALDEARTVRRATLVTRHATTTLVWTDPDGPPSADVATDNGLGLAPLASVARVARLVLRPRDPERPRRLLKPGVVATRIDALAPTEIEMPPAWAAQVAARRMRR